MYLLSIEDFVNEALKKMHPKVCTTHHETTAPNSEVKLSEQLRHLSGTLTWH